MSSPITMHYTRDKSNEDVVIVDFLNGTLNSSRDHENSTIKFGCFSSGSTTRKRTFPVAETKKLTYCPDVAPTRKFCKYLVGVRDKSTNRMQLLDGNLYRLKPKIDTSHDVGRDEPDMTFGQKSDLLTMAFGSSKKKKSVTSRLNNAIKGEALGQAVSVAVEHALSQSSLDTPKGDSPDDMAIIPVCNTCAVRPEEAYRLEDIISDVELDSLDGLAHDLISKQDSKDDGNQTKFCSYILKHLSMLPFEEQSKLLKVKCLLYISYMLEMYHLKGSDIRRKDVFSVDMPNEVKRKLLDTFSQKMQQGKGISRSMSSRMKDKLAAHTIVLMLIIDEFDLDFNHVQLSLKIGQQNVFYLLNHGEFSLPCLVVHYITVSKLMMLLKCLGCQINYNKLGSTKTKSIILKCPVTFQDISRPRPKKGNY